ncbi:MAG: hypothetical protein ACKO2P_21650 [Planctomycetota bacterium]
MLVFQIFRFVMTMFGSLFVIAGLVAFAFLWIVPDDFAGPFGDVPVLYKLLASLFVLVFMAAACFWIYTMRRITGGFLESRAKQLETLQNISEPVRKLSAPASCPRCGAKFLLDHPAASAPANCSFCGSHIPV